jgi:hypothetical protein
MLIIDLELETYKEKYEFITKSLCSLDRNKGIGIYLVPKVDIIYTNEKIKYEEDFEAIDDCINAIKNFAIEDLYYVSAYEAENFFILKNKTYQKVSKIEDARDFMYKTVSFDLSNFDTKDCVLIFDLNH